MLAICTCAIASRLPRKGAESRDLGSPSSSSSSASWSGPDSWPLWATLAYRAFDLISSAASFMHVYSLFGFLGATEMSMRM